MNKFLDDFIKDLSIKDKKTLSQKGLKLAEEVGELARAILPYDCYFESHIGVVISPEEKPYLEGLVEELNAGFFSPSRGFSRPSQIELGGNCKLSQNFFKKSKDGSKFVNMLTYRDSMTCKEDFERDVELIKFLLNEDKFGFEKVEVEYALYDTNVNHDAKWILG